MTNFSRSFALKLLAPTLLALFAGCSGGDGSKELAEGRAAFDVGDFRKAERKYLKANELVEGNVDAAVLLAQLKLREGAVSEAREWIDRAEALAASDTDVRLLAAQIARVESDYAKAARLLTALIEDPDQTDAIRAQALNDLGVVNLDRNEYDLSRVCFLRAMRYDRMNAAAYFNLGYLYRNTPYGFSEAALEQFTFFVRLASTDGSSSPLVQETQLKILPSLKDTINQKKVDLIGSINPNRAACSEAIGKAEAAAKKSAWSTMRAAYREAVTADPTSFIAILGLARAEQKVDSSDAGKRRALELMHKACALNPSSTSALLEAGELAEKLNMSLSAQQIYSRALAVDPTSLKALDGLIRTMKATKKSSREVIAAYQAYRDQLSAPRSR